MASAARARVQVAIIGAGPAGMFLAHLLHEAGIDALVLELRSRDYVVSRVRAGVLEQTTVALMHRLGIGERVAREGLVHGGTTLAVNDAPFHVDFDEYVPGAAITVYGQSEVMKDLNQAADQRHLEVVYEATDVQPHDLDTDAPWISWNSRQGAQRVDCDFIVGCDGFHGVSRACIPQDALTVFERVYPFGWLGVLAEVPPCNHELVYANHEHGFALASMRSPTRSRYYLQCSLQDRVEDWSDEAFWDEFALRIGGSFARRITRGASFEKSIAPLRSFVSAPMRWQRMFLAGDAAHIVPPTGAKGLNLAVADVIVLADALRRFYATGSSAGIDGYSDRALARVWKAERFSWWLTHLTHRFPHMDGFDRQMQLAELEYLRSSRAARSSFAENYVGLPLEI
jgi:p-hydroxybenzoate 3-monooxygenase